MNVLKKPDYRIFLEVEDPRKVFLKVLSLSKKRLVFEEEDEFTESTSEYLIEEFRIDADIAQQYALLVYEIWEECSCSATAFRDEMRSIKELLFP